MKLASLVTCAFVAATACDRISGPTFEVGGAEVNLPQSADAPPPAPNPLKGPPLHADLVPNEPDLRLARSSECERWPLADRADVTATPAQLCVTLVRNLVGGESPPAVLELEQIRVQTAGGSSPFLTMAPAESAAKVNRCAIHGQSRAIWERRSRACTPNQGIVGADATWLSLERKLPAGEDTLLRWTLTL